VRIFNFIFNAIFYMAAALFLHDAIGFIRDGRDWSAAVFVVYAVYALRQTRQGHGEVA